MPVRGQALCAMHACVRACVCTCIRVYMHVPGSVCGAGSITSAFRFLHLEPIAARVRAPGPGFRPGGSGDDPRRPPDGGRMTQHAQKWVAPRAPGPGLPGPPGDRADSCRVPFPRAGGAGLWPFAPTRLPWAAPGDTSGPSWPAPAGPRPKGPAVACGGHTGQGRPGLWQNTEGPAATAELTAGLSYQRHLAAWVAFSPDAGN